MGYRNSEPGRIYIKYRIRKSAPKTLKTHLHPPPQTRVYFFVVIYYVYEKEFNISKYIKLNASHW